MPREYIPRGLPKQAIQILAERAPATLSSAELAELLGCERKNLLNILRWAVADGLISKSPDPQDVRRYLWSLGPGEPLVRCELLPDGGLQIDRAHEEVVLTSGEVAAIEELLASTAIDRARARGLEGAA